MRRIAVLLAVAASLIGTPAGVAAIDQGPTAVSAKTCSSGYKHAVIGGAHKCLRRGQYCARSRDREYHRYGFHCHRYSGGGYRLQ